MIRIGTIWDRTTEVIGGRFAILAAIALLLMFLPGVAQAALAAIGGPKSGLVRIAGLVVFALTVWGTLALTAVASDPAVDRARALAIGRARLGPGVAVLLAAIVVVFVLSLPGFALLVAAGYDFARASEGLPQITLDAGKAALAGLYFFVLTLVLLWASARLVPLMPVVTNERRGLGAFRRSFALTRGSTLKLIGVLILYGIVLLVVFAAATSVFGLVLRLILGPESKAIVDFAAAVAGAAVTAGFSVLQSVFAAQFYVAAAGERPQAAA